MTYNTINYSLDQKLYNYTLNKIDNQLIEILFDKEQHIRTNLNGEKFAIYFSSVQGPVIKRPPNERRIQLAPTTKNKLHTYLGNDYKIIVVGNDVKTNTFTFWRYGYDRNIKTSQSLTTNANTLKEVYENGFAIHYYRNKKSLNNFSFSINRFLFPIVLENYNLMFENKIFENFKKKIQYFNKPYRKDELILCLDLYFRKYPLLKGASEILEISNYCKKISDILGFNPKEKFYQKNIALKFRNSNGVGKKIENIRKIDPSVKSEKKGLVPDFHAKEILEKNYITESGVIDKSKLFQDANKIKNKIMFNDINTLIEDEKYNFLEKKEKIKTKNLLKFDPTISYKNKKFNQDNYNDPKIAFDDIDVKSELHHDVTIKLANICKKKKLPLYYSKNIDFYTIYKKRGKLFEIKTITPDNFKKQIRHAIIQLKEYYYQYAIFETNIEIETDLFILLDKSPKGIIDNVTKGFIEYQNITLCWLENETINTFSEQNSEIDWLF